MADLAFRTDPVPAEAQTFAGVTIALGEPRAKWSLRSRDAAALGTLIGRNVPVQIGETHDAVACLGPDEWLLRLPVGSNLPLGEGLPLSIVEISERAVTLVIEGPRAVDLLQTGCPRDLHRFATGEARRTVYEGVEMILWRTGNERFEIEVWRSFAPHLHLALTKAAAHLP